MIGLFWIINGNIDGYREPLKNGEKYGNTIQPRYDHFNYFEKIQEKYKKLKNLEYDDIPRGRVIFDTRKNKFVILSSKKVLNDKNLVKKVCEFFNLSKDNVKLRWDEHYETFSGGF